jgi:predicted DNA-binding protein
LHHPSARRRPTGRLYSSKAELPLSGEETSTRASPSGASRPRCLERPGAPWCMVVYPRAMATAEKPVRQSVSLPPSTARRIKSLAESSHTSANRILVELIETGLEAREQEKKRFFALADRLASTRDPEEQSRLKEELARMTFGE